MSVKITYFVHGTTFDNEAKKATGWLPGELSPKGISQANALKETISGNDIEIVFCSDLNRAITSANIVFGEEKEIIHDPRLRECNYGDLDGKENSLVIYEDHITSPFPNGESMMDVEKRIKSVLDILKENYNNKHIGIVAHKAPQLAIEVLTQNKTWETAIAEDWRKTKAWQPGWNYILNTNN